MTTALIAFAARARGALRCRAARKVFRFVPEQGRELAPARLLRSM